MWRKTSPNSTQVDPQSSTSSMWTRVRAFPILQNLRLAGSPSKWTRIGAPSILHDLKWPPTGTRIRPDLSHWGASNSTTIVDLRQEKFVHMDEDWGRPILPKPSNKASCGRRELEHLSKWTRSPSTDRNINEVAFRPRTYPSTNPKCCLDRDRNDRKPKFDKSTQGPLGTDRTQTLHFAWTGIWAPQSVAT